MAALVVSGEVEARRPGGSASRSAGRGPGRDRSAAGRRRTASSTPAASVRRRATPDAPRRAAARPRGTCTGPRPAACRSRAGPGPCRRVRRRSRSRRTASCAARPGSAAAPVPGGNADIGITTYMPTSVLCRHRGRAPDGRGRRRSNVGIIRRSGAARQPGLPCNEVAAPPPDCVDHAPLR